MKMILKTNFSVCESSVIETQTRPFINVLSMAALVLWELNREVATLTVRGAKLKMPRPLQNKFSDPGTLPRAHIWDLKNKQTNMDFSLVSAGSVIFECDPMSVSLLLNRGSNTFLEGLFRSIRSNMPVIVWSIVGGTQQILAKIIILIHIIIITNFTLQIVPFGMLWEILCQMLFSEIQANTHSHHIMFFDSKLEGG